MFAAAVFHVAQPYIILAPTRATQLLLGMVFIQVEPERLQKHRFFLPL